MASSAAGKRCAKAGTAVSTTGIKPIGPMKEIWKRLQARRGEVVEVRQVRTADAYLAALNETMTEWNSPEDEEAFRDL